MFPPSASRWAIPLLPWSGSSIARRRKHSPPHLSGAGLGVGPRAWADDLVIPTKSTPVGFEPTRGDPIGLAGRRLNRSAKVSLVPGSIGTAQGVGASLVVRDDARLAMLAKSKVGFPRGSGA